MPLTIQQEFLNTASKRLVVGVAIDGSVLSERALKSACDIYNERRGDKLVILHVSCPDKTYLSKHLQAQHLQRVYQDKAADRHVRAEWACVDRAASQTTCEALTALAAAQGVTVLVVGSYGRKGEKLDMLGSVSDYSLRESHSSVYVVRSTTPAQAGHTFLFTTDGSHAANLAFCTLVHLFAKPQDSIVVAHVTYDYETTPEVEKCFKEYMEILDSKKVPGQCLTWKIDRQQTVADGVLDLAKAKGATCVVIGISGYGSKKVGSVSEAVSVQCGVDTLVVKDPHEVLTNVYSSAGAAKLTGLITPHDKLARISRDLSASGRTSCDGIPAFRTTRTSTDDGHCARTSLDGTHRAPKHPHQGPEDILEEA